MPQEEAADASRLLIAEIAQELNMKVLALERLQETAKASGPRGAEAAQELNMQCLALQQKLTRLSATLRQSSVANARKPINMKSGEASQAGRIEMAGSFGPLTANAAVPAQGYAAAPRATWFFGTGHDGNAPSKMAVATVEHTLPTEAPDMRLQEAVVNVAPCQISIMESLTAWQFQMQDSLPAPVYSRVRSMDSPDNDKCETMPANVEPQLISDEETHEFETMDDFARQQSLSQPWKVPTTNRFASGTGKSFPWTIDSLPMSYTSQDPSAVAIPRFCYEDGMSVSVKNTFLEFKTDRYNSSESSDGEEEKRAHTYTEWPMARP